MNVLDLAIQHGLTPIKVGSTHGGEYASPCPFCGGTDRFRIWPEQCDGAGSYWCRGCGGHGDRITFVMKTQRKTFAQAAAITGDSDKITKSASSFTTGGRPNTLHCPHPRGVEASIIKEAQSPSMATIPSDPSLWMERASKLVDWSVGKLPGSEGSKVLLMKGIGEEIWVERGLGYLPEDIYRPREAWGLPSVMVPVGDGGKTRPKRLWLPAGIVIPHFNRSTGNVDRLRIRRLSGEPRYYVVPGSVSTQMILGSYAPSVVVVESELDAILIDYVAGDMTMVIALGSSHCKPDSEAHAVIEQASCILVALDFDPAGEKAALWWLSRYKRAVYWPVPAGKDPSDAHQYGADIREWVMAGWPVGMRNTVRAVCYSKIQHRDQDQPVSSVQLFDTQPTEENHACINQNHPDPDPPSIPSPMTEISPEALCAIDEVYGLLKKNPNIRIICTPVRLGIEAPEEWQRRNPQDFARLSRRVFFNLDVMKYIHDRGEPVITRENFYRTTKPT